jgi:hypothetical protein
MAFAFLRKKEDWALPAQVAKGVWTCFEKREQVLCFECEQEKRLVEESGNRWVE